MPGRASVQPNSPDVLNRRRQSSCCPGRGFAGEVRPIILTFFDIFKHLRGLKSVDKIKKYLRDSPSGVFTDLGRRDSPHPTGSVNPICRSR